MQILGRRGPQQGLHVSFTGEHWECLGHDEDVRHSQECQDVLDLLHEYDRDMTISEVNRQLSKPRDRYRATQHLMYRMHRDGQMVRRGRLRERYWIEAAQDAGIDRKSWASFAITMPRRMERHELGRNRNEPGDGFRYVFRTGSSGAEGRTEWVEVTEVFEAVEAKDIEAFMRIENGGAAGFHFDPGVFVNGLNMVIPSRTSQQRAADKVIEAVERKLNKPSYKGIWREHGYGTLIVGLPLWFAMPPANPLRVENVVDDFYTRLLVGLTPYARRPRKKNCPFWRIVVVWNISPESMREWCHKARFRVYDDPVYQSLGNIPMLSGTVLPLLSEMMGERDDAGPDAKRLPDATQSVYAVRPKKRGPARVNPSLHPKVRGRSRMAYQVNNGLKASQHLAPPVLREVAKQPVLDLVPLARASPSTSSGENG